MKQVGGRTVWTVAELTKAIWRRFEDVPSVWIEAEISNLARRGQQVYFTLLEHGDDPHLVDASMSTVVYDRLPGHPDNGTLVHAYGRVEFWRQRSQVRFRVERLELTGDGLLLARIDELRRRLGAEGLTADERKRPIPMLPRRIGLVTSGEGAARADFLTNVAKRFPAANVLVVRSLVQGEGAPAEIVRAIGYLDGQPDVDVIVLARGGGPLEDLMAFNSEAVCRAVAASATPIVSAVGHETDMTVCDLVADLRVSTPTKAAEAVVPDAAELRGSSTAASSGWAERCDRPSPRAIDGSRPRPPGWGSRCGPAARWRVRAPDRFPRGSCPRCWRTCGRRRSPSPRRRTGSCSAPVRCSATRATRWRASARSTPCCRPRAPWHGDMRSCATRRADV